MLGDNNEETSVSLLISYFIDKKFDKAEFLLVEHLNSLRAILGDYHMVTLNSMDALAITYWIQSKSAQAELLLQEIITKKNIGLGDNHEGTLLSTMLLAMLYKIQGQSIEAEPLLVKCLVRKQRVKSENNDLENMINVINEVSMMLLKAVYVNHHNDGQ
jgi:hypothetical protein